MSLKKPIHYRGTVGQRVRIDAKVFERDNATGDETLQDPNQFTATAYRPGQAAEVLGVANDGEGLDHFYVNLTTEGITEVEVLTDPNDANGLRGVAIWRAWADPKVS